MCLSLNVYYHFIFEDMTTGFVFVVVAAERVLKLEKKLNRMLSKITTLH